MYVQVCTVLVLYNYTADELKLKYVNNLAKNFFTWMCYNCSEASLILHARIKVVSKQLKNVLKREGEQPDIVVYIDTNDIDRKGVENLQNEYRE